MPYLQKWLAPSIDVPNGGKTSKTTPNKQDLSKDPLTKANRSFEEKLMEARDKRDVLLNINDAKTWKSSTDTLFKTLNASKPNLIQLIDID